MKFFHRYSSTIHGNYRRAYLRSGLLTGGLMFLYVLIRYLLGIPAPAPESYAIDGILLAAVFLLTMLYRNSLEGKRATLKELMLFGMGTALVASVLYGLLLWALGLASPAQAALFTTTVTGNETLPDDPQIHYWAAWWGIFAALKLLLIGCFGAFIAAVFLRNEKSPTRSELKNSNP